ncbi:MAG: TIGR00730 family Rossman fold protein [Xanthomonadales bacterium]|nr:TIGR00730 family Rossman fold protein [Xanthomonadales bacterium]
MEQHVDSPTSQDSDRIKRVTVYASSSNALDEEYYSAASRLGTVLGEAGMDIVYGGGGVGLMRAMADSALAQGAHVHGVIPHFLNTVEHGHQSLSRLEVVNDMRERKHRMIAESDAVVSLPGGSGTFEEVFEVLTLKRLGLYLGPVVLINTRRYFDRFADFLQHSVNERFMSEKHLQMWSLVDRPEQVLDAMQTAVRWSAAAREFAAVRD